MPRERWGGYNEIESFGIGVANKEKKELARFKNIEACHFRVFMFENASKLAIEKAKNL